MKTHTQNDMKNSGRQRFEISEKRKRLFSSDTLSPRQEQFSFLELQNFCDSPLQYLLQRETVSHKIQRFGFHKFFSSVKFLTLVEFLNCGSHPEFAIRAINVGMS